MIPVGKALYWYRRRLAGRSRASAIVEFAVILPLLMMILFGIIEYGWVFMVRLTMLNAAREGCRVAVLQTSTHPYQNVSARIDDIMSPTGLSSYTVTMTHATMSDPTETIRISIPYADVSLLGTNGFLPMSDGNLVATCSMRKEGMGVPEED